MIKLSTAYFRMCYFLCLLLCSLSLKAQHTPITVTGFNQDVVAESGTSSLATTTREMDAITPSNFVMCTKGFATANAFTPANTYGLPDNGTITANSRTYQMAPFTGSNALYLFTSDTGILKLTTPAKYTNISLLLMATEGNANVTITFKFTDSTSQILNTQVFNDWFSTLTTGIVLQGFGRVKRKAGPFTAVTDYEGTTAGNPRLYSAEFTLPCSKTLAYIKFKNTTSTIVTASNRAFVLAASGVAGNAPAAPIVTPAVLCDPGSAQLNVSNVAAGTNYTWFAAATGGFAAGSGAVFNTPSLTLSTTYYVLATNALSGCTSDPRTPVLVTISGRPAAPVVDPVSVCPNNTATLSIVNPTANFVYRWYTAASGTTPVGTGTVFTTPLITGNTTYYAEAINNVGCAGLTRTAVAVTFLPKLPAPVATAAIVGVNSVTFSWTAVTGAVGYQVSVNNGAYQTPSSGATGLTHVASGLPPSATVNFKVIAMGPQACQNSDSAVTSAKTISDQIYIPNSFTPNGDGLNDIFLVYGNVVTGMDMKIFNQWGEQIFQTTSQATGWNGTHKGKQQPVGVYVYVVDLKLADGSSILKKGSINLVR